MGRNLRQLSQNKFQSQNLEAFFFFYCFCPIQQITNGLRNSPKGWCQDDCSKGFWAQIPSLKHVGALWASVFVVSHCLVSWLGTRTPLHEVLHCSSRKLSAHDKGYQHSIFHLMLWEWASVISTDLFSPLKSYYNFPSNIALEQIGGSEKSCLTKLWQRHETLLTRAWRKTPEYLVPGKKYTSIPVLNNPLLPQLSTFMTFILFYLESGHKWIMIVQENSSSRKRQ